MDGVLFIPYKSMKKTPVEGKSGCVLSLSRHMSRKRIGINEMNKLFSHFLKVLINFGLMMKYEWLSFYSIFLATETMHISQPKSNSVAKHQFAAEKPHC